MYTGCFGKTVNLNLKNWRDKKSPKTINQGYKTYILNYIIDYIGFKLYYIGQIIQFFHFLLIWRSRIPWKSRHADSHKKTVLSFQGLCLNEESIGSDSINNFCNQLHVKLRHIIFFFINLAFANKSLSVYIQVSKVHQNDF